jgi:hypothetical protein
MNLYLVVWTQTQEPEGVWDATHTDGYEVFDTLEKAEEKYNELIKLDDTYMAHICTVVRSTDYDPFQPEPWRM